MKMFQNISISHMYIKTEYCTGSDMWHCFRTSVYLTCILKQNIVQGVTCDTVSEHQNVSHVYWNKILYREWHMTVSNISISHIYTETEYCTRSDMWQFQNISLSHMYIETEYSTGSDMRYSFRTSIYLTCILKQNIVHVIQLQNISISHMCTETEYCTFDTVSEHQYISHVYWNRILYREWHATLFQNISISHRYIETEYSTGSDMWYSFRTSVYLTYILKQNILHVVTFFWYIFWHAPLH